MKIDITRDTFDPSRQYARVLLQQGRVQLDADWNEQVSSLLHYLQTLAADIIGPHGGPQEVVDAKGEITHDQCGYEIIVDAARIDELSNLDADTKLALKKAWKRATPPILIGPGRYYVDGVLCENLAPAFLSDHADSARKNGSKSPNLEAGLYLIYIDVWERLITFIDDPSLRDVALGGVDTAARGKTIAQVKLCPLRAEEDPAADEWGERFEPRYRGQLRARVRHSASTDGGYRGLENKLYRVEIHRGSDPCDADRPATFKWSRDNGSVVAAWLGQHSTKHDGHKLKVSELRDETRGFSRDQWVELSYDQLELEGKPGALVQLTNAQENVLSVASTALFPHWSTIFGHPKIRRWDHKITNARSIGDGALLIVEGEWIDLENGIQILFEEPAENEAKPQYRSGDYWLISARTATADIDWPFVIDEKGDPLTDCDQELVRQALPPHGIRHHYAPLATLEVTRDGRKIRRVRDLRRRIGTQRAR